MRISAPKQITIVSTKDSYKKEGEFSFDELVKSIYPSFSEEEKNVMDKIIEESTEKDFINFFRKEEFLEMGSTSEQYLKNLHLAFRDEWGVEDGGCNELLEKVMEFIAPFIRPAFRHDSSSQVGILLYWAEEEVSNLMGYVLNNYEKIDTDSEVLTEVLRGLLPPLQFEYVLDYLRRGRIGSQSVYTDFEKELVSKALSNCLDQIETIKETLLLTAI